MRNTLRSLVEHLFEASRQALRRGVFDLTASAGLGLALGFLQNLALARLLGPEGLGHLSVLNTVINVGGLLATAGVTTSILRYSAAEPEPARAWAIYVRGVALTLSMSSGVALLIALASRSPLWVFDPVAGFWIPLAALTLPVRSLASCATEFAQSRERIRAKAVLELASKVFLVIGVVLCALRWGFLGAVVGFVIGTFAGSALSVGVVRGLRPPRPEPARVATREMLRFGLWGLLTNVLGMALTAADVLCLSAIVGDPAVVGVYSIAVVFQQMVRVPLLAYLDARFPEMARSATDKGALRQLRRRMRAHLIWVAVPSCAGVAALAPWLIPFLFGSEYAATVPILQLLLASHVAFALGAAQGRSLLAQGYVEGNFWASLIAAAANLALLLTLIPAVGAFGTAAATVVSQAIWALATQWLCVRHEASLPG